MRKKIGLIVLLFAFLNTAFADVSDADLEAELSTDSTTTISEPATSLSETPLDEPTTTNPSDEITLSEPIPADGDVVIEKPSDRTLPYKERRGTWGTLFSVNYEKLYPRSYISLAQVKIGNQDILGLEVPMAGAEFGVKYNFSLGSVAALVGYASGSTSEPETGVESVTVSATKLDFNFSLDNIFSEPYIVPYIQGGVHIFDWKDESVSGTTGYEDSFQTTPTYHLKAGLMFQLNWIE